MHRPPPRLRVYLIRHGETDANRQGVMQGQLDTPLNAAGVVQAEVTADALEKRGVKVARAHASDLGRAVKTAKIILGKVAGQGGVTVEQHEALRERYMGDMQGKSIQQWVKPMPANMERADIFAARATGWWERYIVQCVAGKGGKTDTEADVNEDGGAPVNILVVSHGGLIRALLSGLLRHDKLVLGEGVQVDTRHMRCANASVTVIEVDGSGLGRLVQYADTAHLEVERLVQGNVDVVEDDDESERVRSSQSADAGSHALRN